MIVQLYKPNQKNTGSAFSFDLGSASNEQEPCVFVSAVKQFSWNDKRKTGSFSENAKNPDASISIKLGEFEIGGIINSIINQVEFSSYHSFDDNKTQISFKPYAKQNGDKAFSFGMIRNSTNRIAIGLEISEAYSLVEFLKFSLQEIYAYRFYRNSKIRNSK